MYNFLLRHSWSLFGSGGLIPTDKLKGMKSSPDLVGTLRQDWTYFTCENVFFSQRESFTL